MSQATTAATANTTLMDWVDRVAELTKPADVHWCDGSAEEYDQLCQKLIEAGTFERLSESERPNSYLARSDAGDVARVEDRTFI
ncbi:MAG: phosphoenolpyruvate carboxykinase, partial [Thermoleophilaceae bacterium]|nr:phosphoenolpyruvate carboxykinase [Thermoleophilaceae bacterium]